MSRHTFKLLVVGNQIFLLAYTLLDEMTKNALTEDESVFATENSNWPPLSDVPYWLGWILLARANRGGGTLHGTTMGQDTIRCHDRGSRN